MARMGCTTSSSNDTVIVKRFYTEPYLYNTFKNGTNSTKQMTRDAVAEMVKRRMARKTSNVNTILVGYLKSCSAYARPKPSETDFKFIEQRIVYDCESRATDSTYVESERATTSTTSSSPAESSKSRYEPEASVFPVRPVPRSRVDVFAGAYNYQKRLETLKLNATLKSNEKPENAVFPVSQGEISPRPQIIAHCSEADFRGSTNVSPRRGPILPSPVIESKAITVLRKKDDFDTSSENSFVVVHSTVKVAWERDTYQRLVEEAKRNGRYPLKPPVVSKPNRNCEADDEITPLPGATSDFGSVIVENL
ncbi:hypothetical protein L596_005640 [Steinernema carpocapsae]|uniref:Uncharacterized protein n=1 Tax=Steinernema carpocapsae TaxID=34508 RepID=A0A4U8UZN9_STECR|nr:hypothetical protein L596_005640 [Steinernema carpocapsae]